MTSCSARRRFPCDHLKCLGPSSQETSRGPPALTPWLLALLLIFLGSTLYLQSRHVLEARTHTRELTAQRELADKAEASRFTELRSYLEAQVGAEQQRETALGVVLADRFSQQQQVLLARMEQIDNSLAAHIGQLEDRLTQQRAASPASDLPPFNGNTTLR